MKPLFLLIGSNIEPRLTYLKQAEKEICLKFGEVTVISSVYESDPWGFNTDVAFLNRVIVIENDKSPEDVLKEILSIENKMGRERLLPNYSSRTIDIDILYYGNEIIQNEDLIIPHPRLHLRKFTLEPLLEVAPDFVHPLLNKNNRELYENCPDELKVWKFLK